MTFSEAIRLGNSFYRKSNPTEDDVFMFTEAMEFLINETHNPMYMMQLGGYYYEERKFDLALKYYELAAEYKYPEAYNCHGYVWYYGRTGTRDFKKAFEYFTLAAETGDITAEYKLADMYKNGYYVEKDYEKYKEIIEKLYFDVEDARDAYEPLPEIYTRLARIRTEDGKTEEAVKLYLAAKDFLAQRIGGNAFFGDLNIMMWLIDDLYKLRKFDESDFDLYDLYYLLKSPCRVQFCMGAKKYIVEASEDEEGFYVRFGGEYYRGREDLFKKACIGKERLTALYNKLFGFKVI